MSDPSPTPRLTIAIPTMGRPILIRTLKSVLATHGMEDYEIIVAGKIAEGPVLEELRQLLQQDARIRHFPVSFEKGDSSEKKNVGWREARADIIAFLDDDVVVAPDWTLRILEPFEDPEVGGVSGPSLVPSDVGLFARLAGVALQSKAAGYVAERYGTGAHQAPRQVGWSRMIGCDMCYRKSVLEDIGGFERYFWPGEEMLAAYRAGLKYKLMFYGDAYVYHYPRASFRRFWKQMHGYGATRIRLFRAGVEFEPTTIVPAIWVLTLLVFAAVTVVWRPAVWLLLLDMLAYLMVDVFITLTRFSESRKPVDLLIFFLVPIMHLSYGWAEWLEFFRPNKDLSEHFHVDGR
ncbi:MAG: glycosyltransferase [Spartobacteria bacterium]|nr:glycosyltransferase [Spartobacteria bacterium]